MPTLLQQDKFKDPYITAKGETRAAVTLTKLDSLWLNTGTLCNIECANCYILSSPRNDSLVYLSLADVVPFLDDAKDIGTREIGITGGEPFMNPDIIAILDAALTRGFEILLLTNAMRPMMRPKMQEGLLGLREKYAGIDEQLTLRISLDHYDANVHDAERGQGAFAQTMIGMQWLAENGFTLAAAGRMGVASKLGFEEEHQGAKMESLVRQDYAKMFATYDVEIDCSNPSKLVLFPEMNDEGKDPPEITVDCWDILSVSPDAQMCATSRMVVKRKGEEKCRVLSCTLLFEDDQFSLGHDLKTAEKTVQLNHPHCATFCVLGGASCS